MRLITLAIDWLREFERAINEQALKKCCER